MVNFLRESADGAFNSAQVNAYRHTHTFVFVRVAALSRSRRNARPRRLRYRRPCAASTGSRQSRNQRCPPGPRQFDKTPAGKLILLTRPLHDKQSVDTLKALNLDVGLHQAGVIYRDVTIDAFRLGILNHHIGLLPAYRGRSVMEWSILQGDAVGITVFFIDAGIDTGAWIVISEEVDISHCGSIAEAKQHLFDLDKVYFPKALASLKESDTSFQLNDGSGRRYFVMSKLFSGVVAQLLEAQQTKPDYGD